MLTVVQCGATGGGSQLHGNSGSCAFSPTVGSIQKFYFLVSLRTESSEWCSIHNDG